MKNNKIGDKIFDIRNGRGLSQDDFAQKVGVTRQTISQWEANRIKPKADKIQLICQVLEISVDELMSNKTDVAEVKTDESTIPMATLAESQVVQSNKSMQVTEKEVKKSLSNKTKFIIATCVIVAVMLIGIALIIAGVVTAPPENDWSFNGADEETDWNFGIENIGWICFSVAIAIGAIFGIVAICKVVKGKKKIQDETNNKEIQI